MSDPVLISLTLQEAINDPALKTISYVGSLLLCVDLENFGAARDFVQAKCDLLSIFCDCTSLSSLDQIVSLLDSGCTNVVVSEASLNALVEEGFTQDHLARLTLSFEHLSLHDDTEVAKFLDNIVSKYGHRVCGGLGVLFDARSIRVVSERVKRLGVQNKCFFKWAHTPSEDCFDVIKRGYRAVLPATCITTQEGDAIDRIHISKLITKCIRSDRPDGLFPTVVTDESGMSLGLVYSSIESVEKAISLGRGVYYSRSRSGLWIKGEESGNTQELRRISLDCDADALQFTVRQSGEGFCHLQRSSCFGMSRGISKLETTLKARKASAPDGSYTAKLFKDPKLLQAKILEEAQELGEAQTKKHVAEEAADLLYFALAKCVTANVQLSDIESSLDRKSLKVKRRKGDAKKEWADKVGLTTKNGTVDKSTQRTPIVTTSKLAVDEAASAPVAKEDSVRLRSGRIKMKRLSSHCSTKDEIKSALQRPSQRSTASITKIVEPILEDVRAGGDAAVLKYTHQFEKATSLTAPVLRAPFPESLMQLPAETMEAINVSFNNIYTFHAAQREERPLQVETMPGVVCSRFVRPIERVGLYVPGGTAVLPSTAMMLGIPAMVAGCGTIVFASPPRKDGSITPEIVYIAHKVGAESIVLAGGAQAVAAMAYGTESISKVDKILGPGNQFVTAAKMIVANDTAAGVSIDMPAGPSEVLVIADKTANPAFVASDLLSQAEHGVDSQVILIAVDLSEQELLAIEDELHNQANTLPRVDIVRGAIDHSVTLVVRDIEEAMDLSNMYAPEHLILQVKDAAQVVAKVQNAGSVFVGPWTPESVGDYSAGTNHSLPTFGYAKQYSGVNLSSFTKHITCSNLTKEGLSNVGKAVMQLAKIEKLEAHRRAVSIRLGLTESTPGTVTT